MKLSVTVKGHACLEEVPETTKTSVYKVIPQGLNKDKKKIDYDWLLLYFIISNTFLLQYFIIFIVMQFF